MKQIICFFFGHKFFRPYRRDYWYVRCSRCHREDSDAIMTLRERVSLFISKFRKHDDVPF